jgi:peptide/nickel transport system permease protein
VKTLVLRRLALLIPMVWLVATLTFLVVAAAPGSYADTIDHPGLSAEQREALRARYGLDQPLHRQYFKWLGSVVTGDLGTSFVYKEPVARLLARTLPPTLLLGGAALLLDLLLGLVVAVSAARRPHGWFDRVSTVLGLGVYGLPSFWVAGLAVLFFALLLGWFPASHMRSVGAGDLSPFARLADHLHHLILPAACLGLVGAAGTARYLRAALLDLRSERFILAARARGLSERRVLWVHTLRPALLPVVTLLGLSLPFLVSGSVVIEAIFSWPGTGLALLQAAHARDVPVIMGITLIGAVAVLLGNLVADVLYAVVDPRARGEGS